MSAMHVDTELLRRRLVAASIRKHGTHDQSSHGNWSRGLSGGFTHEEFAAAPGAYDPGERRGQDLIAYQREWAARFDELPDDTPILVFHATTNGTAALLQEQGFIASEKPTSLARMRYESGEYAEYSPGAGLGDGAYVGIDPKNISGYGNSIVAMVVPKSQLAIPPEETYHTSLGRVLFEHNGAMMTGDVPPDMVENLYPGRREFIPGTPWEEISRSSKAALAAAEGLSKRWRTADGIRKHATHDQSTHGNWADGTGSAPVSRILADVIPTDQPVWAMVFRYIEKEHVAFDPDHWAAFQRSVGEGIQNPVILYRQGEDVLLASGHHRVWAASKVSSEHPVPFLIAGSIEEAYELTDRQAADETDWKRAGFRKHADHDQSSHGNWADGTLFHGTSLASAEAILKEGFTFERIGENGTQWGDGVYLTADRATAEHFAALSDGAIVETALPGNAKILRVVANMSPEEWYRLVRYEGSEYGAKLFARLKADNSPEVADMIMQVAAQDSYMSTDVITQASTQSPGDRFSQLAKDAGYDGIWVEAEANPFTDSYHQVVIFDPAGLQFQLSEIAKGMRMYAVITRPRIVKHYPGQHDQSSHGNWAYGQLNVWTDPKGWEGDRRTGMDDLWDAMGVPPFDLDKLRSGADADGRPILEHGAKNRFSNWEVERTEPIKHLFRVISEQDYQRIQSQGYIDTDGNMNLVDTEGLVTSVRSTGSFYAPQSGHARIIRIDYRPEDGWKVDIDEYVKTQQRVPADRISLVSPLIEARIEVERREDKDPAIFGTRVGWQGANRYLLSPDDTPTPDLPFYLTPGDLRRAGIETGAVDIDENDQLITKHYGPGPHANGTEQSVHGRAGALSDRQVIRGDQSENLFGLPGGRTDAFSESPEEVFRRRMLGVNKYFDDFEEGETLGFVYDDWVNMQASKDIRLAALDIIGEDGLPADPHSDSEATWGGALSLEPTQARASAEFLMGSIAEGENFPELYRSIDTNGLDGEEAAFWDNIVEGDQFDAPLMATMSRHPVIGDTNLLDKFSSDTLIRYEGVQGVSGNASFTSPMWEESDEEVWLSDMSDYLRSDAEMFRENAAMAPPSDTSDAEQADAYERFSDAIDDYVATPTSEKRNWVRSFFLDHELGDTRFAGDPISENQNPDEFYDWGEGYDGYGSGPREVITGGRFEVTAVEDLSGTDSPYNRMITVRQTHLFDPYRDGNLIERDS